MHRIRWYCLGLVLVLSLATAAPAQRSRTPRAPAQKGKTDPSQTAVADFTGTVQANNGKTLIIEGEDSNTLQFNCNRRTRYFDGKRQIQGSGIHPGQYVSVAARPALDASLDALEVHIRKDKPKPKETEPPE